MSMQDLIHKYGREEAKEHKVTIKIGEKLARDHLVMYGPKFYSALEKLERRMRKK